MKTLLILAVLVVAALAAPQANQGPGGAGGAKGAGGRKGPVIYGPGVHNRFFRPNPFQLNYAKQIASLVPQAMIRVNWDGSIDITDRYGREAEVVDQFGRELTEFID